MVDFRKDLEYRIVGSCMVQAGAAAYVAQYLSDRNFSDQWAKAVWCFVVQKPNPTMAEIRQATQVPASAQSRLLMAGTAWRNLTIDCLALLEICFRTEAVKILKTNRNHVLIPLAPLEKDIENEGNDAWSIITAAANYCADAGLSDIADQLTVLLSQMSVKAASLKDTRRVGVMVDALKSFAVHQPGLLKIFSHDLKEISNASA
jgi:hypothetical protein